MKKSIRILALGLLTVSAVLVNVIAPAPLAKAGVTYPDETTFSHAPSFFCNYEGRSLLDRNDAPGWFIAGCAAVGIHPGPGTKWFYKSIKNEATGSYYESARTYCGNSAATNPAKAPMDFAAFCSNKAGGNTQLFGKDGVLTTIINTALFFIGGISVLMLIIGGIRYVMSAGNEKAVTAAKSTILYAVIGVIIALLAYAIVNFVLGTFKA